MLDAPLFEEILPDIVAALDGRVVVGHNISFDLRFLAAELERAGYQLPQVFAIDTQQIARQLLQFDPPVTYKLHDIASHLGFTIHEALAGLVSTARPEHSAFGDAVVTTHLLARLIAMSCDSGFWDDQLTLAARSCWPPISPPAESVRMKFRPGVEPSHSVSEIIQRVDHSIPPGARTTEYSALLDDALADRILDADEVDALVAIARKLGLGSTALGSVHRDHFDALVAQAWADEVLTREEIADITRVAELLRIDDAVLQAALQRPDSDATPSESSAPVLEPGSIIVLTGQMTMQRSEVEAEITARGHIVGKSLTKKTSLLIAADTFTQSGKAQKARKYGITVLAEADGLALIRQTTTR